MSANIEHRHRRAKAVARQSFVFHAERFTTDYADSTDEAVSRRPIREIRAIRGQKF
jgi:hypothetical protein